MAATWWWSQGALLALFVPLPQIHLLSSITLTFSAQMPIKGTMLRKAPIALWAFERLLSSVMADMSHQRAFLPEASHAELTHVRFLITMGPLMHLQGILRKMRRDVREHARRHLCLS